MTDTLLDQTPNRLRRFACMMYEAVLLFGVVFLAGYLMDTLCLLYTSPRPRDS